MNFNDLRSLPNAVLRGDHPDGKYGQYLKYCGIHRVRGWKFDYFRVDGAWNSEGLPDIVKDPNESIYVLAAEVPPRVVHSICEMNGIYTGHYQFDHLEIDSQGSEAVVIRLAHQAEKANPRPETVIRLVENAVACGLNRSYIDNVIIGRSNLGPENQELFFSEELYSEKAGKAFGIIRSWFMNNLNRP